MQARMHMISLRPQSDIHMWTPSKFFIFKLSLLSLSMKCYLKRTDLCIVRGLQTNTIDVPHAGLLSMQHASLIIMMYDLLNSSLQEHT